ncbi:dCTP deaminase domain-containing protein, partial [Klebsiella pneumoniae]|uniref:dCTP deaminase domain-containing protein n=1 Tax=Klebsiella pneumoniae TaxID=573 RepID=UPI0039683579
LFFIRHKVREKDGKEVISFGLSSYGYDVRLARNFKIFSNVTSAVIDPLDPSDGFLVDWTGDYCIIPPNSYILGHTVESFNIPDDDLATRIVKAIY